MIVRKVAKRKRLVQTTLDDILKRQRIVRRNGETNSLDMADVIVVSSSDTDQPHSPDARIETTKDEQKSPETDGETDEGMSFGNTILDQQQSPDARIETTKDQQSSLETEGEKDEEMSFGNTSLGTQKAIRDKSLTPSLETTNIHVDKYAKKRTENIEEFSSDEDLEEIVLQPDLEPTVESEDIAKSPEAKKGTENLDETSSEENLEEILLQPNSETTSEDVSDESFIIIENMETTTESEDKSPKTEMKMKKESDDETQDYELLLETQLNSEDIEEPVRRGVEFDTLLRAPECCGPAQTLTPSQTHTILFRPYHPSHPYPSSYRDNWDRQHVRMPCSKESLYPAKDGEKKLLNRWELIRRSLRRPMTSSYDLEDAILSYNAHHAKRWNFRLLHIFLLEKIGEKESKEFFEFILPGIIRMALALPEICTQPLPLLKRQEEHTITVTQQQVASLLANAFLCTFPRRNASVRNPDHEFGNYPDINFNRLFQLGDHRQSPKKVEKLKCILHYFNRVLQRPPLGTISYKRQVLRLDETPKWHSCSGKLSRLRVASDGTIEDDAPGLLQVDFANKFVGGGVLGEGCVQEEIRFAICPELILSRLFTERLEDNECLIVTGAERFSDYVGYAGSFQWAGDHVDRIPRDSWGRLHTQLVAIDAKPHMRYSEQFSPANLKRELEKAFCGFLSRQSSAKHSPALATGKWGCGAFNGDPQLKSLIQIMAASAAHRDVLYFTFEDKEHANELHDTHFLLKDKDITIGELWQILNNFKKQLSSEASAVRDLFEYIRKVLGRSDDVTDSVPHDSSVDRSSPLLFDETHF